MLKKPVRTQKQLAHENADLRTQLDEAEETLRAIRSGEVDALVVPSVGGDQLYTLKGADRSYRVLIEEMNEGALTVTTEGVILYANRRCAEILRAPLEKVIGSTIDAWVAPADQNVLQSLLRKGIDEKRREELALTASDGTLVPVFLSASNLLINETPASFFCLVATDLTEQKRSEAIAAAETLARELLAASDQARLTLLSMVEDLKQSEEALRESRRFVQATLDALSAHIAILDASGQIVAVNRAWREFAIANHPNPESVCEGTNYLAVCDSAHGLSSEEAANTAQGLRAILSGARNEYALEYPCHAPNEKRWFIARATKFKEQGPIQIVVAHENITERKEVEEALRENEAELAEAQRIAHVGSWDWIAETDTPTWSKELCAILEVDPNKPAPSMADQDKIYTPESMQRMRVAAEQTTQTGMPYAIELERARKDGSSRWVLARGERWVNQQGQLMGLRGTALDITERKRAELENQRQLQRLNGLRTIDIAISSSFDIRVILDILLQQLTSQLGVDAANILVLNPSTQILEYTLGWGFRPRLSLPTQVKLDGSYAGRAVVERRTIHIPNLIKPGDKLAVGMPEEDFVDYYCIPLIAKNEVKGVLEIYNRIALKPDQGWLDFMDTLTGQAAIAIDNAQLFESLQYANAELEHRVAQRTTELHQTNTELQHANRTKDEFLATMSHELRTPLNSVLGLSEMLLEQRRDPLSAHQQRSIQTIEASGRHLLELINDVLDLSKIEAGKFDYFPQVVDVDDLCHSSLAFIGEQALQKSVRVTYQPETTVSKIYADPRRLKQILVNLLANAVKFTPNNGEVTLQVNAEAEQDRIQFSIIDTGIGVAAEDLKKLFQPFVQLDSRLTREYEGTGLGLALVQRLTDLHGGSVSVESAVGKGSRFTINLVIGQALIAQQGVIETGSKVIDQAVHKPAVQSVGLRTILLAEDNMSNIMTMGDYLEVQGYQVIVAHNGVEALEQAEAHQPDMILMDIQMPVMDGLEAIRHLRANPRFASTPIIALTALAMPGDRERCLESGANEYLSKPVSLKSLVKTIENFLAYKIE